MSKRFLKLSQTFTQDLSSAALSFTTTYSGKTMRILWVSLKATQAINETVTITLDSVKGATFDIKLCEVTLVSERDFMFRPQGDLELLPGDELKIECTDGNGIGSVSGEVRASETKS